MTALGPGTLKPLPSEQVVAGSPSAGVIGVWEMTNGTATDTDVDEVFVVLADSATVSFESPELPSVELAPGSVVRLTAGMHTTWVVRETLRKIYLA